MPCRQYLRVLWAQEITTHNPKEFARSLEEGTQPSLPVPCVFDVNCDGFEVMQQAAKVDYDAIFLAFDMSDCDLKPAPASGGLNGLDGVGTVKILRSMKVNCPIHSIIPDELNRSDVIDNLKAQVDERVHIITASAAHRTTVTFLASLCASWASVAPLAAPAVAVSAQPELFDPRLYT